MSQFTCSDPEYVSRGAQSGMCHGKYAIDRMPVLIPGESLFIQCSHYFLLMHAAVSKD